MVEESGQRMVCVCGQEIRTGGQDGIQRLECPACGRKVTIEPPAEPPVTLEYADASTPLSRPRGRLRLIDVAVASICLVLVCVMACPTFRALRRQGLMITCGANHREFVYACLGYANDRKEVLPNLCNESGQRARRLYDWSRLPILGFDTMTQFAAASGIAYVMRDYRYGGESWSGEFCEDGWVATAGERRPNQFNLRTNWLYLPHRPTALPDAGPSPAVDTFIARKTSDPPNVLLASDFMAGAGPGPSTVAGNHFAGHREEGQLNPFFGPKYRSGDPDCPRGGNTSRIDGRVTWNTWANLSPRYLVMLNGAEVRYWW